MMINRHRIRHVWTSDTGIGIIGKLSIILEGTCDDSGINMRFWSLELISDGKRL